MCNSYPIWLAFHNCQILLIDDVFYIFSGNEWQWFHLLSIAIQTADSLIDRTSFPVDFINLHCEIIPGNSIF